MRADGRGKETCIFVKCTYVKNPEQVQRMPMMGRSEGKCGKVNNEKKRKQQHTTGARWKI